MGLQVFTGVLQVLEMKIFFVIHFCIFVSKGNIKNPSYPFVHPLPVFVIFNRRAILDQIQEVFP